MPPPKKPVGPPKKVGRPGASKKTPLPAAKPKPVKKEPTAPKKSALEVKKETENMLKKKTEAIIQIQRLTRGFLAKKTVTVLKDKKTQYERLMQQLEKEAIANYVKMQQQEEEEARKKEEEERRRRREDQKRKRRMLEAAFEGDDAEIVLIIKEIKKSDDDEGVSHDFLGTAIRERHLLDMTDCEDANGNTPLSEAAAGGQDTSIQLLLENGANPNSRGHFNRTPLYRAAFAGHLKAVEVLLEAGADPRLFADDGTTPEQIASTETVKECLQEWDLEQTELLLEKMEIDKQKIRDMDAARREAEAAQYEEFYRNAPRLADRVRESEKELKVKKQQLKADKGQVGIGVGGYYGFQQTNQNPNRYLRGAKGHSGYQPNAAQSYEMLKCQEELEKRIKEYDRAMAAGFERPEVLKQAMEDSERELNTARMEAEVATERLQQIRLQMREAGQDENELPGLKVNIKELDDVLMRDVGDRIKDSGKWPMIIDPTQQAATFLRYRDTNYINALSPRTMEKDRIRMAIVGALRFGKACVLDMFGVDMFDACAMRFDEIQDGLMKSIMDRSIIQEEKFTPLLREADGPDYQINQFNNRRTKNFRFMIITQLIVPPEKLMQKTYPIRILNKT